MNKIERIKLIKNVTKKLLEELSLAEIQSYFNLFGIRIDLSLDTNYNTPFDPSEEITYKLSDQEVDLIREMAKELELLEKDITSIESANHIWQEDSYRCFISHLYTDRVPAANLQKVLKSYNISSFVAHNDIAPSKKWEKEILLALNTSNCLLAIITPKFIKSKWTDQEVGIAVGLDKFIIPINKGEIPYGFVSKYQAINSNNHNANDISLKIVKAIIGSTITSPDYFKLLVKRIINQFHSEDLMALIDLLEKFKTHCKKTYIGLLYKFVQEIEKFDTDTSKKVTKLNEVFKSLGYNEVVLPTNITSLKTDDLPF